MRQDIHEPTNVL